MTFPGFRIIVPFLAFTLVHPLCEARVSLQQEPQQKVSESKISFWTGKAGLRREIESLRKENSRLQGRVDSLSSALERAGETIDSIYSSAGMLRTSDTDDITVNINDSLLRVWYVNRNQLYSKAYDMEVEHFTSDVPDSVFIRRLSDMNSFICLPFNDIVKNYCILYSERMKSSIGRMLELSHYYWPIFDQIFSTYDIPLEIKALAVVESMMRPEATSRAGAKGLWQFMHVTAKGYGLRINSFMDERMDPVKSTVAAARHLRDLYRMFGDWSLALAAYNCGVGNVNKAIRRSGGAGGYWEIYSYLPRETRGYVPAFVGALYALHYYKEYGIQVSNSVLAVPVDTFEIKHNLHYSQIAELTGADEEIIGALNPQYMHKIIPGDEMTCILKLPAEYSNAFIDAGDSLYRHKAETYLNPVEIKKIKDDVVGSGNRITYKVKSGDFLGRIASRYGVTVKQIKKWNGLKSDNIRIGQKLVIYTRKK